MQPPGSTATATEDRPGTPPRPPYSPVTPVFAHLDPVAAGNATIVPPPLSPSPTTRVAPETPAFQAPRPPAAPAVFKPEPPPVPISESENPDAIALRSAISILQMQKQQSLRDIQSLERMKDVASADPEAFARDLAAGKLRTEDTGAVIQFTEDDEMDTDEDNENETDSEQAKSKDPKLSPFGRIPAPQNVVRMPPINWSKYHVVGESLDGMHEEQLRRPSPGDLRRGEPAPEHLLASPYRPFVDRLDKTKK